MSDSRHDSLVVALRRSAIAHCEQAIDVEVQDGATTASTDVHLFLPTGPCQNVPADFCASANLFCSTDHVSAWQASNSGSIGDVLDLQATAQLGRDMWGGYAIRQ